MTIADTPAQVSPFGNAERTTAAVQPVVNTPAKVVSTTAPSAAVPAASGIAPVAVLTDTVKTKSESKAITPVAEQLPVKEAIADNTSGITEKPVPVAPVKTEETKPASRKEKKAAEARIKDIDGDGLADDEDECPYIKGSAATKGCPDSDGDGIPDLKDQCPMEFGLAELSGCPAKSLTADKSQLIKQFRNIEFETGKAIVRTPDIYDIIEYAIDVMYQYPNSTIILTGHTDSEGDELHNMKLSEARVNTVKRYLTGQGVSEKRIKAVFYGETMPLMENSTEYGKARNRRVEINIIR